LFCVSLIEHYFCGKLNNYKPTLRTVQLSVWSAVHYVVFARLVGGLFIVFGFQTRLAVIFPIPILMGAVFFVNITNGFTFLNSEFWISLFVLVLLVLFLIVGSRKYSLDNLMDKAGYNRSI